MVRPSKYCMCWTLHIPFKTLFFAASISLKMTLLWLYFHHFMCVVYYCDYCVNLLQFLEHILSIKVIYNLVI